MAIFQAYKGTDMVNPPPVAGPRKLLVEQPDWDH